MRLSLQTLHLPHSENKDFIVTSPQESSDLHKLEVYTKRKNTPSLSAPTENLLK